MQSLPRPTLDRLRNDLTDSYLVEDFVLSPASVPSLSGYSVVDEVLRVSTAPRTVRRTVRLRDRVDPASTFEVELGLGVGGPGSALALMIATLAAFQRSIPFTDMVHLPDPPVGIGDAGLGWAWDGSSVLNVVALVRTNVFVLLRGSRGKDPLPVAREIDDAVVGLRHVANPTDNPYYETLERTAEGARRMAVHPGGRIGLPLPPSFAGRTPFFEVEHGSVNRDFDDPGRWYYRAGLHPGRSVTVDVLSVGAGIVPRGTRVSIAVTGREPGA